jgi:hypothetical protein
MGKELGIGRLPDGRRGFVATLSMPSEGAAPGESGELIYFVAC